ncbi:MAG: TonB-dependent receptor [Flavobacteriales bacterium]|nr:TonB-dependent receptor [Flavobacteriales bacterium]
MFPRIPFLAAFIALSISTHAQTITQTIRGTVFDKVSNQTLPGAVVILLNTDPAIGAATDMDGNFKLPNVPVGRQTLVITYLGYKEQVLSNVIVNSGKELVLTINMEEDLREIQAVEVVAQRDKKEALNNMTLVSTRTFSVEETQKFAAAFNDPGRTATSFAGVVGTDDGGNNISIRGNSPYGLLWRMEGVDIPNPNHFAEAAESGGGISIISSQLLANSDFMTGAFSAEYGNALAGVFDLKLRKGNNEKREYTLQAGILGLDIAAEGPFAKGYEGSFLFNYRLSTLTLLQMAGLNIIQGRTDFQDLSYNIYLPTKKAGTFSIFGFGGLSKQSLDAERDSLQWEESWQSWDQVFFTNTAMSGMKHVISLSDKTYLQTSLVYSGYENGFHVDTLTNNYEPQEAYFESYRNGKINLSTIVNHKFNAKHSLRAGAYVNRYDFNLVKRYTDLNTGELFEPLNAVGDVWTLQAFAQWKYRVTEQLTFNLGAHYLELLSNHTRSIEPRAALKYALDEKQNVSIGYGLHSQMQPIGVYVAQVENADGTFSLPNENVGLNKAHHIVLAYDRSLTKHMYVKVETYYQQLFNIAVENTSDGTLSAINNEYSYITEPLVNNGKGYNYGVEFTLEQFTHNNMYFLLSTSLYESQYKTLENVWRNTRFNGNYAVSFTGGKEWNVGKPERNKVLGVNARLLYSGGLRTTPIDLEASIAQNEEVEFSQLAYTNQLPYYLRTDLRISLKRNFAKATTTLSLDLQNATNRKNVGGEYFDAKRNEVHTWYMLPLLPILAYRVEF